MNEELTSTEKLILPLSFSIIAFFLLFMLIYFGFEILFLISIIIVGLFSLVSFTVGLITTRDKSIYAGLGVGFSYVTMIILKTLTSVSFDFNGVDDIISLGIFLIFIPIFFSIGVLTTWFGSFLGDLIRAAIKKNWRTNWKIAFLLNFVYSGGIFLFKWNP